MVERVPRTGRPAVRIVGIGDNGCASLTSSAIEAIRGATVLVGGQRHLAFFPDFEGERIAIRGALAPLLDRVAELAEDRNVCVLASGDPLFYGVATQVIRRLGADAVEVLPQPSSVQWAFARIGMPWEDAHVISFHGRPLFGLVSRLRGMHKVAILTDAQITPACIARHLLQYHETGWDAWVCEHLTGSGERVRRFGLEELSTCVEIASLNVMLLIRRESTWRKPPRLPFLHEDRFAKRMPKKGLITKREVRLLSLAALNLGEDSVMWDVGAASGSVAIEASMLAPLGRIYAIEMDPDSLELCRGNIVTFGADNVEVVAGRAPEALAGLAAPTAVFIGGSKGSMGDIIHCAWERLQPGGCIVTNAVTLENAGESYEAMRQLGASISPAAVPEVILLQVSRSQPLARYQRFEALNPIQILKLEKPLAPQADCVMEPPGGARDIGDDQ